jgi:hypothetical protein
VYHHQEDRADQLFKECFDDPAKLPLDWLLRHDEYDFFGLNGQIGQQATSVELVRRLRHRDLPHRAAVIHPATVNVASDEESLLGKMVARLLSADEVDRKIAREWFRKIKDDIQERPPAAMFRKRRISIFRRRQDSKNAAWHVHQVCWTRTARPRRHFPDYFGGRYVRTAVQISNLSILWP